MSSSYDTSHKPDQEADSENEETESNKSKNPYQVCLRIGKPNQTNDLIVEGVKTETSKAPMAAKKPDYPFKVRKHQKKM